MDSFGASLSGADARYTKAGVCDESRRSAIESSLSALTLRLRLSDASISDSPLRVSSYAPDTKPYGARKRLLRRLPRKCTIGEALYNLRSLVYAIIGWYGPAVRPIRVAKSLEACECPHEPLFVAAAKAATTWNDKVVMRCVAHNTER